MTDPKPVYKSKTMQANAVLAILFTVLPMDPINIVVEPAIITSIYTLVNMVLRLITTGPIGKPSA